MIAGLLASCVFWVLHPQIPAVSLTCHHDDVFMNARLMTGSNLSTTFSKIQHNTCSNWSCLDRPHYCITDDLSDDSDDARPFTLINSNTQGHRKRASCSMHVVPGIWDCDFGEFGGIGRHCPAQHFLQSRSFGLTQQPARENTNNPWDKDLKHSNSSWIYIYIILFTVISELAHTLLAQELRRQHVPRKPRRVALGCNLVRGGLLGFVFRVLLFLWLVWFSGAWGFKCVPLNPNYTRLRRPCKYKTKYSKKLESRTEKVDVKVDVLCHGVTH